MAKLTSAIWTTKDLKGLTIGSFKNKTPAAKKQPGLISKV